MSKKMMKRSLVLGALMAFVITGQAWAKAILGSNGYQVENNIYVAHGIYQNEGITPPTGPATDREWDLQGYTLWVDRVIGETQDKLGDKYAVVVGNYDFTGGEGSKLQISSDIDGKSTLSGGGLATCGNIDVDKLIINVTGKAVYASATTSITANEISLSSTGNEKTVYVEYKEGDEDTTLMITPKKKLEISSDGVAVRATAKTNIVIASPANQKADIIIDGNVDTLTGSTVSLKLETASSQINGSINAYKGDTNEYQGTRNITLSGGATWNVTDDSDVTTLDGDNANIIVNDLKENLVTIGINSTEKLTLSADAGVGDLTGDSKNKLTQVLRTTYITTDNPEGDNTVRITGDAVYEDISAKFRNNMLLEDTLKETVASTNIDINSAGIIGLLAWRAETNDMNKRMGELRNANGEHGVWVRMVRGEDEYKSVKHQYNQYQLGYDEKLSTDPSWTVGAALTYTDGESSYAKGSGENTHKGFAIYGSKLNDDGTFIDLIAKYSRLDHDFKAVDAMGDGEYDTNGYSVSAEYGKRIQQGNGLWIEPQVELTYGKVSAVDYVTKKDVKVAQDGMESLVGRVGFSLGKDISKGNVYARASYLYDFEGETKAVLGGDAVLENDLGGGWWEVGVGANINLSKATYIYADVEKTFGGEVDTNWQWNLGVRYSF